MATSRTAKHPSSPHEPRWGEEPVEKIITEILAAPGRRYDVTLTDEAVAELDALWES